MNWLAGQGLGGNRLEEWREKSEKYNGHTSMGKTLSYIVLQRAFTTEKTIKNEMD